MRVLLLSRLRPITDLSGESFWTAFRDGFVCHYLLFRDRAGYTPSFLPSFLLWKRKVRHRNISASNFVYYVGRDKRPVDVLNDVNLSTLAGQQSPSGNQRTGTLPFLAVDLLCEDAVQGKVVHLYRNDAESFAWVLVWICSRYDGGKEIDSPPPEGWMHEDIVMCFHLKHSFVQENPREFTQPTKFHKAAFEQYIEVVFVMQDIIGANKRAGARKILYEEPSDLSVYDSEAYLHPFDTALLVTTP